MLFCFNNLAGESVVEMAKLYLQHGATELEPEAKTAELFPSMPLSLNVVEPQWYVVYTSPRHEKAAANHLNERSVEQFLPLFSSARLWNGRRAVVQMPLFPGYLFARIRSCDRLQVLEAPGVIRIIGFNGQLTPVADEVIESLKASLQLRKSQPHPFLAVGKRVRITTGPLRGLEGVVLREAHALRMIVSIDSIMRSFSVELDAADLESSLPPARKTATRASSQFSGAGKVA